jgi:AcrR family transcriptional regulator
MPKIIQNVREQLLNEAKRQIAEFGYDNTTIRSVAGACGLGVGTVYNYFKSKDMLIASFLLDDWFFALAQMKRRSSTQAKETIFAVYDELTKFIEKNASLFSDKSAAKTFAGVFSERHKLLRSQLAEIILPICEHKTVDKMFLSEFIAESVLTWTVAKKDFEEIFAVISALLK